MVYDPGDIYKILSKGVFAVNKIKNCTSGQVLGKLKLILVRGIAPEHRPKQLKLGHGGTLDHTATGVLVVASGWGCKVLPKFLECNKKYLATGCLGIATDTYNESGIITQEKEYGHITRERLENALQKFHGQILQTPPQYSALKHKGRRIADWTRSGVIIEMKPRPVICHHIKCTEFSPPYFQIEVVCGGGFYIRSLVNDLGHALDSCAHVTELHRSEQGPFTEEEMLQPCHWTVEHIISAINKAREKHYKFLKRQKR